MKKKKLYWIFQITGWSLYIFVNLFFIAVLNTLYLRQIFAYLLLAIFFVVSTHIFRNFILKKGWLKLVISKLISKVLSAVLLLSLINSLFQVGLYFLLNFNTSSEDNLLVLGVISFPTTVIVYIIWSLLYFMYHYVESYNTALKYEAVKNEIELNKLKSQLNPHFIFNALNSIRALVDENPSKAKLAITQLSNILRNSLIMDKKRLTEFDEEMETVKDYLDLETIRFEERLRSHINIHQDSGQFMIPPLMVQTLVENGIKHGISHLKDGGEINIDTEVKDNMLTIQIRNSGQYQNNMVNNKDGYGISNTIQRLKLLFGDQATFSIKNENEKSVLTEIKIPKHV